jgi:hypothetical protein
MVLLPTGPGRCDETSLLTSGEWRAVMAAGDDGVTWAGLAVDEGELW